ncbi:MAG: ABC transporter permease [Oligoflexia bacterium]|nr:ABC transporter permease [Oligoflexia bacterium]MBF0365876.1 ABC transporter permease [Oligoflexia bacterium]
MTISKTFFKFLFTYSFRNLWRRPKQTLVLMSAIIFSCVFILWVFNLNYASFKEIIKEITSQYVGISQLTHENYYKLDKNSVNSYKYLTSQILPPSLQEELAQGKFSLRVSSPVFLSASKKTLGVMLVGTHAHDEFNRKSIANTIVSGSYFDESSNKKSILLGKRLAYALKVSPGEEIVVLGQGVDGSLANDLFVVRGIFDFGGGELEKEVAFTTIENAREFFSMPPTSFHIVVANRELKSSELPPSSKVISWRDLMPDVALSLDFFALFIWIVSIVIIIVVSFGTANSLFISFVERKKEMEMLNIVGAPNLFVISSLFIEVCLLTLLSLAIGNILSYFVILFFSHNPINLELFTGGRPIMMGGIIIHPKIYFSVSSKFYLETNFLILLFTLLAMIYPLLRVLPSSKQH